MSTRIIAEFENIDSAETAARLIRYRINDVHAVRLNSREEIHDVRMGDVTMAFPINDDVSIAPVPLMSSYGSAGDLSSAFHPYRSVNPKEYEPALRQNTILTVEVDDDCAGLASNLMYSQGGHDVKKVIVS